MGGARRDPGLDHPPGGCSVRGPAPQGGDPGEPPGVPWVSLGWGGGSGGGSGAEPRLTLAWKWMPCWKASSLCSGTRESQPSSTRLYRFFTGIAAVAGRAPQAAAGGGGGEGGDMAGGGGARPRGAPRLEEEKEEAVAAPPGCAAAPGGGRGMRRGRRRRRWRWRSPEPGRVLNERPRAPSGAPAPAAAPLARSCLM